MSKKEKEIKEINGTEESGKRFNAKKLKFGSMSIAVIVLVIAIVIVVNLMCGLLMKRYPLKVDLTSDNRHEISQATIDVLEQLDKDVEITVTSPKDYFASLAAQMEQYYARYGYAVDCPFDIIPEILDKYSVYAEAGKGSVSVRYVDINKDPQFAATINDIYSGELTEGCMVVKCGDRVKVITQMEVQSMITQSKETQNGIKMVFAGESIITSAVRSAADLQVVRAAIATTMDGAMIFDNTGAAVEYSLENFLAKNGYDVSQVDLSTDALSPEDYDVLVISAPAVDFSENIIEKLSSFLYNGGQYSKSMIYIPNITTTNLPNLNAFLEDWKISVENAFLGDDDHTVQLGQMKVANCKVADDTLAASVENAALPLVAPYTRPITIVNKNNECLATPLVTSYETGFMVPFDEDQSQSDKGTYNVVVKARKEKADGLNVFGSNLLVIGGAFMLDDSLLSGTNTYSNANVLINAINDATGKAASAVIPEKALEQYNISLTAGGFNAIRIVTIIVIPLLIAVCGFVVLLWRKNK